MSQEVRCPVHPNARSSGVCSHCGMYVCELCTEQGTYTQCLACRERLGRVFPFTRDAWTVTELGRYAWATFKREWKTLVVALFVVMVPAFLLGLGQAALQALLLGPDARQKPFALGAVLVSGFAGLVTNLVLAPLMIGYIGLSLNSLRGRPVELGMLFAPYARFVAIAGLVLLSFAVGLGFNLALSPFLSDATLAQAVRSWLWLILAPIGIYLGTSFGFAYAALADDAELGAIGALKRSFQAATGHRWQIILVWLASGLAMFAGMLMCCFPALIALPWASLLWSGSYLALRTPTPVRGG